MYTCGRVFLKKDNVWWKCSLKKRHGEQHEETGVLKLVQRKVVVFDWRDSILSLLRVCCLLFKAISSIVTIFLNYPPVTISHLIALNQIKLFDDINKLIRFSIRNFFRNRLTVFWYSILGHLSRDWFNKKKKKRRKRKISLWFPTSPASYKSYPVIINFHTTAFLRLLTGCF